MKTVTVVIPVHNEAGSIVPNLNTILTYITPIYDTHATMLIVDDGSSDGTTELVRKLCEQRQDLHLLCLNRHFGKEAAIQAGLDHANTDAVIVMDSDLQHPPNLIPQMVALWLNGIDVVEAYKLSRGPQSITSRLLVGGFYRVFRALTELDISTESDFKLLDRKVVVAYRMLPERVRFFRGLMRWMAYPSARIPFDVPNRAHRMSRWTRLSLLRYSISALTSFSSLPLYLVSSLGLLTFVVSVLVGTIALYDKLSGRALGGFTTVILLLLFIGSSLLFSLGLLGSYVARIYEEVKARPIYTINWRNSQLDEKL